MRWGLYEKVGVTADFEENATVARAEAGAHAWDGVVTVWPSINDALEPFRKGLPYRVSRFVDEFLNYAVPFSVAAMNFIVYQKRTIK